MKIVVTSYKKPDIDGIASMYAYSEYLKIRGINASYYFEGIPRKEVNIVLETYGINLKNDCVIKQEDKFVLVDTNTLNELPNNVDKENIIEIIDHHRKSDWLLENTNIKVQIELIGAAATLIAERFKNGNIPISRESAILLYNGIVSNTMNLKIKLTSTKDIEMANWLKNLYPEITDEKTKEIFIKKSNVIDRLRDEMEVEIKDSFITISWTMGQLEIANVLEFLDSYEEDVRNVLKTVKKENDVCYISVNCMDIINGYTVIVSENQATADLISDAIGVSFVDLKAKVNYLISRKEIIRVIREIYKR